MRYYFVPVLALLLFVLGIGEGISQEEVFVYGDPIPNAPELAYRGDYHVGVRTITVVNPEQVDILNGGTYDRELTLEVWYPASLEAGESEMVMYEDVLGRTDLPDPIIPFSFLGRAARDAAAQYEDEGYPLIIVSHGYPGSRYMLTYLNENLASKGYVVVAIDHTESTFLDTQDNKSTLLNRVLDQEFVLRKMAELSEIDEFFTGLVDANNTAIIGFSMGGYGALNAIGAAYNPLLGFNVGAAIRPRLQSNPDYPDLIDTRIKAAVLFSPFGGDLVSQGMGGVSMWSSSAMEGITIPTFWIVGTEDDLAISDAIVRLFDESINSERYLLTFREAMHNIAPNPPPPEAVTFIDYQRYAEFAWDKRRVNNISQHFVTAFLDLYLKGDESMRVYIEPKVEVSAEGVIEFDEDGNPTENYTYWAGFLPRSAIGLELRYEKP